MYPLSERILLFCTPMKRTCAVGEGMVNINPLLDGVKLNRFFLDPGLILQSPPSPPAQFLGMTRMCSAREHWSSVKSEASE